MADDCRKYEDKLSAFLDGQLNEQQMAEVVKHLKTCSDCSLLLKKMKSLNRVSSRAMDDLDVAILSDLEDRIMIGIDALGDNQKEKRPDRPRIIPIWYRYAAVAASAVFIFLVGRFVFDDSVSQLFESKHQKRQIEKLAPADMPAEPSATKGGGVGRDAEQEPLLIKDEDADLQRRDAKEVPVLIPDPVPDEEVSSPLIESPAVITESREHSRAKISLEPEQAVDALGQSEKEFEELPAPKSQEIPPSRSSFYGQNAAGKKSKSLAVDETEFEISERKSFADDQQQESLKSDITEDAFPGLTAPIQAEEDFADGYVQEESQYVQSLQEKMDEQDNTLAYHYAARFIKIWDNQKPISDKSLDFDEQGELLSAARMVYDEAMPKLDISNAMLKTINLYIAARAAYDLYRFSGDESFLKEASSYREKALEIVYYEKHRGNKSRFVEMYREELESWEF